jgi:lysophospholipase L1-like esterase
MRRGFPICLSILAVLAILGAAGVSIGAGKKFSAYSTCKPGANHPDPYCIAGSRTTATFIAHDADRVSYTFCVRKPGGKRNCHSRTTGRRGSVSKIQFSAGKVGHYDLTWKVGSRKIDHDEMQIQKRRAFVNGDSLAEGTRPYLPKALHNWSVSQSVSVSRHLPQGVAILRRMGNLPPVVVMSLGTNDDPGATSSFRSGVRATMKLVGRSGCVVWPNIVRPPVGGHSYAGYNGILAEESKKRRNLRVVEWTRMVAKHPGWLASDHVHVNATGYQARAEAIAKQAKRC